AASRSASPAPARSPSASSPRSGSSRAEGLPGTRAGDGPCMAHVQERVRPVPRPRPRPDGVPYRTILVRAAKNSLANNVPTLASAIAYSAFLTIPSILLVAVGVFGLVAGPGTVHSLVDRLGSVMPADASRLLDQSLTRVTQAHSGTTLALTVVGILL